MFVILKMFIAKENLLTVLNILFNILCNTHSFSNGHYVPVVFCLLINKYVNAFKHIIFKCINLKLTLNSKQ